MLTTHRLDPTRGARRSLVLGRGGMACTSQPLASFAAATLLRDGANALDAAVAAAATLAVVEPFMTGLGGDCMLLYWHAGEQRLYGLDGSGRAPAAATIEALQARGCATMPLTGPLSITVPGTVDAWCTALARFGSRSLAAVLAPAIDYAQAGFAVSEIIAAQWGFAAGLLQDDAGRRCFAPAGRAPRAGEVMHLPALAASLRALAAGGREVLYDGPLGAALVDAVQAAGGLLTRDDLRAHRASWVEPIHTDYRGTTVCELPPSTQGLTALLALNILEAFQLDGAPDLAAHLRIEAMKLALADRDRYLADPAQARVPVATLLSKDYAQGRAALIRPDQARKQAAPGVLPAGDTVYLATADAAGNVASLINSLYLPFGSGLVAGDTGIAVQNRGAGFSLDPAHPNCLAPGKRPLHTIIPAMLLRGGRPLAAFGVMGGDMQAQGHLQVVSALIDDGDNLQEAIERARFNCLGGDRVALERDLATRVGADLARRGHVVADESAALLAGGFGGAQAIGLGADGVLCGASDPRKDGCAIGF